MTLCHLYSIALCVHAALYLLLLPITSTVLSLFGIWFEVKMPMWSELTCRLTVSLSIQNVNTYLILYISAGAVPDIHVRCNLLHGLKKDRFYVCCCQMNLVICFQSTTWKRICLSLFSLLCTYGKWRRKKKNSLSTSAKFQFQENIFNFMPEIGCKKMRLFEMIHTDIFSNNKSTLYRMVYKQHLVNKW